MFSEELVETTKQFNIVRIDGERLIMLLFSKPKFVLVPSTTGFLAWLISRELDVLHNGIFLKPLYLIKKSMLACRFIL
jgi:hypothetical protein